MNSRFNASRIGRLRSRQTAPVRLPREGRHSTDHPGGHDRGHGGPREVCGGTHRRWAAAAARWPRSWCARSDRRRRSGPARLFTVHRRPVGGPGYPTVPLLSQPRPTAAAGTHGVYWPPHEGWHLKDETAALFGIWYYWWEDKLQGVIVGSGTNCIELIVLPCLAHTQIPYLYFMQALPYFYATMFHGCKFWHSGILTVKVKNTG